MRPLDKLAELAAALRRSMMADDNPSAYYDLRKNADVGQPGDDPEVRDRVRELMGQNDPSQVQDGDIPLPKPRVDRRKLK